MKKVFSYLQYVFFLGGGLLLVWWQLRVMTPEEKLEFNNSFSHANYMLIIPVVLISIASHISRSMRWKLLMEPLGFKPALKNVFAVTMVGYLANSAIPRLGEILKCTLLARYEKLKADKLIGTILIERAFDLLCYVIFILITVLIQIDVIGGNVKKRLQALSPEGSTPLWIKLMILACIFIAFLYLIRYLFRKFPDNKFISKIKNFFTGIGQGIIVIKNLRKRKGFLLHTLFIWSMYLLQIYIGFSAMEGTQHLSIKAACSVLSLATLAMIVTPGGIGSFPIFVMETLLIYNIPTPQGKAFGWLIWGVSTGIIIVAGLISLIVLPYINKNKDEKHTSLPAENIG
jgi:glycosyltransferase 2 family protein